MWDGLAGLIENGFRTIDRNASNFFIVGQVRETVAVGEAAGRSADTHPDERRRSSEKRSASKRSLPEKRFTRDNQSSRRSGAFAKFDNKHRKSGR